MKKIEEQYLGQILTNNSVFYESNLQPADFSCPQCRALFGTMQHIVEKGLSIDYVTAKNENQTLNAGWLSELPDKVPSTANHKYYSEKIKEASNKRKLAGLGNLISDGLSQGKTSDEIKEAVELELTNLSTASKGWDIKEITPVLFQTMETIEERFKARGTLPGIESGFGNIDDMTLGFRPRMLYLFGARPSRGKTALMLNMAVAASKGCAVGLINTESANEEMGMRMISSHSGIDSQRIASGNIGASDINRLSNSASQLSKHGLIFYDEPNASLSTVIAKCREMVRKHKVKCIFIDYIQNISYSEKSTERENLGHVSTQLKALARSLNIPIVAMAQLRREGEQAYKQPVMSDLLGSGKLEQDADVIGLIWWNWVNAEEVKKDNRIPKEFEEWVMIDKNRDGMTGAARVKFHKSTVKFTEIVDR